MADALGQKGEAIAAKYYQQRGCLLLGHNYHTRFGELDLIVLEGETLVFAEVKTRSPNYIAPPAEAVTPAKQKRLIMAAKAYLQSSPYADAFVRFDVVEVVPQPQGWQVHCIKNAFEC